ncbi:MAG: hypothetical protein ITG02_01225 [Patulibacter sp.]|nr:hypothetical protein [Patulibacter sp.]
MSDPTWYPVRFGPLRFASLVGPETESLGDKLEAVGSALVPGERGATSRPLTLPVRGSLREVDDRAAGLRLRRQVRALLGNRTWLSGGLYLETGADPESRCWLAVGSGELAGNGRGITFADWRLELEAYRVGSPAEVCRGRRIVIADRAQPGVASDTRRTLYTTDRAGWDIDDAPRAYLPGSISTVRQLNEPWTHYAGPSVDGRPLWTEGAEDATAGGVSWSPDRSALPSPVEREPRVEEHGEVRAWWMPTPWSDVVPTAVGDRDPTVYGWERLLGAAHDPGIRVAIDNGWCRLVWIGTGYNDGVQLERWDDADGGRYVPVIRLELGADPTGHSDMQVIELTPERAVIARYVGGAEYRMILQRGWPGPRIEAYPRGTGIAARLAVLDAITRTNLEPGVDRIELGGEAALVALATDDVDWGISWNTWSVFGQPVVAQFDLHPPPVIGPADADDVKRLARWDVQQQPILMTR